MAKSTIELQVEGMTCQGCVRSIEKKLSSVDGVSQVHVNLGAGKTVVEYDEDQADPAKLVGALEQIGFPASRL